MIAERNNRVLDQCALLDCPHCHAGNNGLTVGLYWDINEEAWRCFECGHRIYEKKIKTQAQLLEDLKWERVFATFENEELTKSENGEDMDEDDEIFDISQSLIKNGKDLRESPQTLF